MLKKIEKYLYIVSPLLILTSLIYFYLTGKFETVSIVTLILGVGIGIIFFIRFYDDVVKKITKRKVRYGINSTIITIVVIALVVIAYLVLMDNNKVFDLTKTKRFSLSDQTRTILQVSSFCLIMFVAVCLYDTCIKFLFNNVHCSLSL